MLHLSAKKLLLQLDQVTESCKDDDFYRPLDELSGFTFGQHVRHTLEFFLCLFDAKNDRKVNYDWRKHDALIETDKRLARSVIDSIIDFLEKNQEDFELVFETNYTEKENGTHVMKSSFHRELAYNIEHAIHHMALMKIAVLQSLNYISPPEHFGVANSTVRYRVGSKSN